MQSNLRELKERPLNLIWDLLWVLAIGPDAPELIASMAMDGNAVWVASGPYVIKYTRGKEVIISPPLFTL